MLFKEYVGVDDDFEAKWETHHLVWKLMEIRETIVISISDQFWNAEAGGRGADEEEQEDRYVFDNELGYNFRDFDADGGRMKRRRRKRIRMRLRMILWMSRTTMMTIMMMTSRMTKMMI